MIPHLRKGRKNVFDYLTEAKWHLFKVAQGIGMAEDDV